MNSKDRKKNSLYGVLTTVALIALDQFTKLLAIVKLKNQEPFVLIEGVFELRYLENRGAAFGIFQNQLWFFILMTIVIVTAVIYYYRITPDDKKYRPIRFCMILLIAGAVGNCIDRVFRKFVVDFLYFSLIDFPIFNVADIYVTVTFVLFVILMFFYYKDEDFLVYSGKHRKEIKNK